MKLWPRQGLGRVAVRLGINRLAAAATGEDEDGQGVLEGFDEGDVDDLINVGAKLRRGHTGFVDDAGYFPEVQEYRTEKRGKTKISRI